MKITEEQFVRGVAAIRQHHALLEQVRAADGRLFATDTPEQLWTYWRETETGPFEGGAPNVDAGDTAP